MQIVWPFSCMHEGSIHYNWKCSFTTYQMLFWKHVLHVIVVACCWPVWLFGCCNGIRDSNRFVGFVQPSEESRCIRLHLIFSSTSVNPFTVQFFTCHESWWCGISHISRLHIFPDNHFFVWKNLVAQTELRFSDMILRNYISPMIFLIQCFFSFHIDLKVSVNDFFLSPIVQNWRIVIKITIMIIETMNWMKRVGTKIVISWSATNWSPTSTFVWVCIRYCSTGSECSRKRQAF